MSDDPNNIIYDWNVQGHRVSPPMRKVELFDETLRDGIQCPSITDPPIEKKLEIIRLLDSIGVNDADIALPGAGKRAVEDCTTMVEMIRDEGLTIRPAAAARRLRPLCARTRDGQQGTARQSGRAQ